MKLGRRLLSVLTVLLFSSAVGGAAPPLEELEAAAEATVPDEAAQARGGAQFVPYPSPQPTPQALVEQRRDLLRKGRAAMLERYGHPGPHVPPWHAPYNAGVERYRNERRQRNRQRRDQDRLRRNGWLDAICPWSKPQRDRSRERRLLMQMEQLDRQEYRGAFRDRTPRGYPSPIEW